jgi:maltose alpha-D-glucosyltransferase/alpha-amylase
MRDVAGMIRSFDYAAAAVGRENRLAGSDALDRAGTLLASFRETARQGLLTGYAEGRGAALDDRDQRLLDLFTLEKVAYEIAYEAANRPAWLEVPVRGLGEIATALLGARRHG